MNTKIEYPATHSMSTSWFGIDKDGNVAIIDFNENGPAPSCLGEECTDSIIEDILPSKINDSKTVLALTDTQAQHLIDGLMDADVNNPVSFSHLVQIDPSYTEQFIALYEKNLKKNSPECYGNKLLCMSSKYGIYILDFYDWDEKDVKTLYAEKILLKCIQFDFWCEESWDEDNCKWVFDMDLKNLPFYHYQQPYWPGQLIERTYIPRFPLKESQLDLITRKLAIRFPFSFGSQTLFQISEFIPCKSHDGGAYLDVATEDSNGIPYPDSDGGIVKVDEDSYPEAMSDTPRIFIIEDTLRDTHLFLSKELPFIKSSVVFQAFHNENNPWNRIIDSIEFEELCRLFEINQNRFEHLIATIRPYCIIAMPKSFKTLQKYYKTYNGHLLLDGTEYPLFTLDEAKHSIETIERYRSMPYRGNDIKRIKME